MSTLGQQLKALRAERDGLRQEVAGVVAEQADASGVLKREIVKAKAEVAEFRAELAELTNGGPVLDEPTPVPSNGPY